VRSSCVPVSHGVLRSVVAGRRRALRECGRWRLVRRYTDARRHGGREGCESRAEMVGRVGDAQLEELWTCSDAFLGMLLGITS
jgi:hypothetical protein